MRNDAVAEVYSALVQAEMGISAIHAKPDALQLKLEDAQATIRSAVKKVNDLLWAVDGQE